MAALDTGATANLARFEWLGHRNSVMEKFGAPPADPHPARAGFKFGEVRHAADIPVGIAGGRGIFTAFPTDTDIPALLHIGALGALGV